MMIRLTLLELLLLLAFAVAYAEDPRDTTPRFIEAKSIVNRIDRNLRTLKPSSQTFETGTDRGGEVTIYRQDSGVVRIDLTVGFEYEPNRDILLLYGKFDLCKKQESSLPLL